MYTCIIYMYMYFRGPTTSSYSSQYLMQDIIFQENIQDTTTVEIS